MRNLRRGRRSSEVVRCTVYIPISLMVELKKVMNEMGLANMSEVVRAALWDYVLKNAERRAQE